MTDYEVLHEFKIGGVVIKDCSTPTFVGWIAKKINNLPQRSPMVNELTMLITNPPIGKIDNTSKLELIRKLEKLGIEIC